MTKLIAEERAAPTTAKRLAILGQMQTLAAKDLPTIPYWQGDMIVAARSTIHGVSSTAGCDVLHATSG